MKSIFKSIIISILTLEARLVLAKYKPRIVAVTGTVGKTSTKDALYAALAQFFYVRKSQKSFNGEIGVPLTILGLENAWSNPMRWFQNLLKGLLLIILPHHYPRWLVLEVGADRPGDIKHIAAWLSPDVVVITRFSKVPVHIEFFASPEEIIEEKSSLAHALKDHGVLILGSDDEVVCRLKEEVRGRCTVTFGTGVEAEVRGSHYEVLYESGGAVPRRPIGITFNVAVNGSMFPVYLRGTLGAHLMQPVLAAFAVGRALQLNLVELANAFGDFSPPPGRMRVISGKGESVLIDDTYNASPVSMEEALRTLALLEGKKIAILGDMMELGGHTVGEHRKIGRLAKETCTVLMTVGPRAKEIVEGAVAAGMSRESIRSFRDSREAAEALQEGFQKGDIVLVKGSQSPRMERIVKSLMAEPEHASELLVRQEKEWERR